MHSQLCIPYMADSAMSAVRWLALLPDPAGFDSPITAPDGTRLEWVAADQDAARAAIRPHLTQAQWRLCAVVSVVDWDSRPKQQPKVRHEPHELHGLANPRQSCWRCGAPTPSTSARYCHEHRSASRRRLDFRRAL